MRRWLYKTFGKRWYIWVVIVIVVSFLISASGKKRLTVFDPEKGDSEYTVEKQTEKPIVSFTYLNDKINLSLEIPEGWERIVKDGYDTFVHAASASSVQVQVLDYYPAINNTTDQTLAETYAPLGCELTEFAFTGNNSYYDIYQKAGTSGITDYIEQVLWDRSHVVKVLATINDQNYQKLSREIWYVMDNISWACEDPVPEGCYLAYMPYGDFEVALPSDWILERSDAALFGYNEENGSSVTVTVLDDPAFLDTITEIDYADFLSQGKQDFILNGFYPSPTYIYGEATYNKNGVQAAVMQAYYATGTYQYIITYEFPVELADAYYEPILAAIDATRFFAEPVEYVPAEDPQEAEAEEGMATFSLDGMAGKSDLYQEYHQDGASAKSESAAETGTEAEADSFEAALAQLAGLSSDQAAAFIETWTMINAGNPTYAKAYKESDEVLMLMITNEKDTDYYVTLSKSSGAVIEIRLNAEDGPVVYAP